MIVISDTSPFNYLILIGHADVLPRLYGEIVLPAAVVRELQHAAAPEVVREFIGKPPPWLSVRAASLVDPSIGLGAGESEAISLAIELRADRILIDDRAAYRAALQRGLNTAGTLTVLADAASAGLLRLPEAIEKLRSTTFRVSEAVVHELLKSDAARQAASGERELPG